MRSTERELPAADAPTFVRQSIGRVETRFEAAVVYHTPLDQVARAIPHDVGEFTAIDAHTTQFRTTTHDLAWLALQLARVDIDFTVQEPAELVDVLRDLGQRITAAVDRSHPS